MRATGWYWRQGERTWTAADASLGDGVLTLELEPTGSGRRSVLVTSLDRVTSVAEVGTPADGSVTIEVTARGSGTFQLTVGPAFVTALLQSLRGAPAPG